MDNRSKTKDLPYLSVSETVKQRNRMRENCSSGSVGERGGNEPLYPENIKSFLLFVGDSSFVGMTGYVV